MLPLLKKPGRQSEAQHRTMPPSYAVHTLSLPRIYLIPFNQDLVNFVRYFSNSRASSLFLSLLSARMILARFSVNPHFNISFVYTILRAHLRLRSLVTSSISNLRTLSSSYIAPVRSAKATITSTNKPRSRDNNRGCAQCARRQWDSWVDILTQNCLLGARGGLMGGVAFSLWHFVSVVAIEEIGVELLLSTF